MLPPQAEGMLPRMPGKQAISRENGWSGLFESAFRQSQNAMALVDGDGRVVRANPALSRLLGYKPSAITGEYLWDFMADPPADPCAAWCDAIERGEVTGEADFKRADGDIVHTQFGLHPEEVTGRRLVLFVALRVSRWGRHFRRPHKPTNGHLSDREHEIVGMVAMGETSTEIADSLHISPNTVRKHVNSAMAKLGARSRAHLVAKVLAAPDSDPD